MPHSALPAPELRWNRRALLQAGCTGWLGLALPTLLGQRAAHAAERPAGKTKQVILILLTGGASHHDTFDLKPDAPDGIRGDFKPIDTAVPGVQICEHLPLLAARANKLALVRSMSHGENSHLPATHKTLTGYTMPLRRGSDLDNVLSRRDWPCYAAVLDRVQPRTDGIPSGVVLPNRLIEGPLTWPGQHAGFLGGSYDPWQIARDPNSPDFREETLSLPAGITLDRLGERQALLGQVNSQRSQLASQAENGAFNDQQKAAIDLLVSGKVAQAFDMHREDAATRDRYGRHLFGQSLLLARRLVQAGVPIVQANMGIVQTWDTHDNNFVKLKDRLLPALDRGVAALIDDLAALGLWDNVLVAMAGEFGRTPKIGRTAGAAIPGRDHWPQVYTAAFFGGGVQGGQVIGRSDKIGAYPITRSFTPDDLGATVFQALGLPPGSEFRDLIDRPLQVTRGEPIRPLYTGASA